MSDGLEVRRTKVGETMIKARRAAHLLHTSLAVIGLASTTHGAVERVDATENGDFAFKTHVDPIRAIRGKWLSTRKQAQVSRLNVRNEPDVA